MRFSAENRSAIRGMDTESPIGVGSLVGGVLMTIHRLSQGGADRVAMLLANGLAAAGIPVGVAILRSGGEGEEALLDLLDDRVLRDCAGAPMGSRHLELVRGLRFIRRLTSAARPAIVLASSNNMGLVTGLSARPGTDAPPRYVMKTTNPVVRPCDRGSMRTRYRHQLYRFVFSRYDQVLTLSDAERGRLARLYPHQAGKFHVTANAYVTPEMLADYDPVRAPGMLRVLTLARLMPQKRLDLLLAAFARVATRDSRLTIVGDGPERPRLLGLARSLGISDRVDMPGFVGDVVPWIRGADLFALSSDYEGLPAAVLEALACNVPVVTTDCFDGVRSLLAGAPGCAVVPRGDVDALAAAIDAGLRATDPVSCLRDIARPYGVDVAIASHIAALRPLLVVPPSCQKPGSARSG